MLKKIIENRENILRIKNLVFDHIYLVLILASVFFLPLYKPVIPYTVGFLIIFWVAELNFIAKFKRLKNSPIRIATLSFAILYVLYVIGLIYSDNNDYAIFDLQVKLTLFVLPLFFSTVPENFFRGKRINAILITFVLGCLVSTGISLGDSVYRYSQSSSVLEFYYSNVSYFHHAGYFAMYLNFAVVILISFLIRNNNKPIGKWTTLALIVLVIYFSVYIILLSSKAGIISLMIVFFMSIGYIVVNQKKILTGIWSFVIVILLFFIAFKIFPYALNRIVTSTEVVENSGEIEKDSEEGTAARLLIWTTAFEIIENNFFLGVGTGDVKDVLLENYKKNNITNAFKQELNAHNQYLQTFLSLGILGLMIIVFLLIIPAYYALKNGYFTYFLFLIVISINFLIESVLETQAGVVFYAFFNSFLFYITYEQKKGADEHRA